MKSTVISELISIELTESEAVVLFEWLHNFNQKERSQFFEDQAEERLLNDLESDLESVLSIPFQKNYNQILSEAREKIRDKG